MRFAYAPDAPLHAYSNDATIAVGFAQDARRAAKIKFSLTYQPCDDTRCLPPVTQKLVLG